MYTCKVANARVNFTRNIKNTYQHKWALKKSYFYASSRKKKFKKTEQGIWKEVQIWLLSPWRIQRIPFSVENWKKVWKDADTIEIQVTTRERIRVKPSLNLMGMIFSLLCTQNMVTWTPLYIEKWTGIYSFRWHIQIKEWKILLKIGPSIRYLNMAYIWNIWWKPKQNELKRPLW